MRALNPQASVSLKTRIATVVLLLFLGSIWLFTYMTTARLRQEFADVLANQQFASASYTASEIEQKILLRFAMLEEVACDIAPAMLASPEALHILLASRPLLLSRFDAGVVVISREGIALADFPQVPGREGASFTEQSYFRGAMENGKPTLGKPHVGRFTQRLGVGFAVPIRTADGQIIGVLSAYASLDDPAFVGNIQNARVGTTGWIAVNDARHRLIVAINDPTRVLQPFPPPGVNTMLDRYAAGHEGSGIAPNAQGREVLSSAKQVGATGWFVQLVLPTDEAFEPIRDLQTRAYLLAGGLSIAVALIVWIVIRQLLKPLAIATADIHAIATGTADLRELPIDRHDEVGELLDSFNQLFRQRQLLEAALEHQASTDYLTGLPNRRSFFDGVAHEMARLARYDGSVALLMLDIDHFKAINDSHGHQVGDVVLQTLANVCRTTLREIDLAARFGGEEFAFLLPGTQQAAAREIAERLRAILAQTSIALDDGTPLHFTVSIGVTACSDPAVDINTLLNAADQALYEAKRAGRNQVSARAWNDAS